MGVKGLGGWLIHWPPMRTLRYLPLVAFAGVDGFAMFLPYLAFVGLVAYVVSLVKGHPQPVAVT